MQYSHEHLKTMVYAKFGGQTECIIRNWKIENYSVDHYRWPIRKYLLTVRIQMWGDWRQTCSIESWSSFSQSVSSSNCTSFFVSSFSSQLWLTGIQSFSTTVCATSVEHPGNNPCLLSFLSFTNVKLKFWRIHLNSVSTTFFGIKWYTIEKLFQAFFSCPILTNQQYSTTVNFNSAIS